MEADRTSVTGIFAETRRHWSLMTVYERFAQIGVILIALLAPSGKFIILDTATTDAATITAVAGATFVLGIVYWLPRERDDRSRVTPPRDDSISG